MRRNLIMRHCRRMGFPTVVPMILTLSLAPILYFARRVTKWARLLRRIRQTTLADDAGRREPSWRATRHGDESSPRPSARIADWGHRSNAEAPGEQGESRHRQPRSSCAKHWRWRRPFAALQK